MNSGNLFFVCVCECFAMKCITNIVYRSMTKLRSSWSKEKRREPNKWRNNEKKTLTKKEVISSQIFPSFWQKIKNSCYLPINVWYTSLIYHTMSSSNRESANRNQFNVYFIYNIWWMFRNFSIDRCWCIFHVNVI